MFSSMLIGLLRDPVLRAALESAAHWDEDVLVEGRDIVRALRSGHPRALVVDDVSVSVPAVARAVDRGVAMVRIEQADVDGWESLRRKRMPPPVRRDFYAARIRALLPDTPPTWVDRTLADLGRATGAPLPMAFRAVARRVLEDPARFRSLEALVPLTGLAPAALRARFRRRGLPSPLDYVRGLRLLAVAHHLARSKTTVSTSALGLGFHSSGNLARFSRSVSGRLPSDLRRPDLGPVLLLEFVASLLGPEQVDGWRTLDRTFVEVA